MNSYPRWCSQNAEKLRENNSFLEFNLHRLNFIKLIQQGSKKQIDALCYSRKFQPFGYKCSREIQKLMTSLLYVSTGLENSPYSEYLNPELWDDIEEEFIKNACKVISGYLNLKNYYLKFFYNYFSLTINE